MYEKKHLVELQKHITKVFFWKLSDVIGRQMSQKTLLDEILKPIEKYVVFQIFFL